MGFVTNQWLKGEVERNRRHSPTKVAIEPSAPFDEWDKTNQIVAHIRVSREDGDYQSLYLTQSDIAAVMPYLISQSSMNTKSEAAIIALASYEDKELAILLEELFFRRRSMK